MKKVLKIVLIIVIALISYGFYINFNNSGTGEKFIGIGVVIFAFILMPLFIFHRYNGKDLSRYSIDNMLKELDKDKDKKRK